MNENRITLSGVAAVVAVCLFAACDDEGTGGTGAGGGTGATGATTSVSNGGDGGGGGEPTTCGECSQALCQGALDGAGCAGDPACSAWSACLSSCPGGDPSCAEDCNSWYVVPEAMWTALYSCLCTSCSALCASLDACNETRCGDPGMVLETAPATLAETGLYKDINAKTLNPGVRAYAPEYPLWSDGAEKARYVQLPRCATIDTSDMDHWSLPVGTKLWKEFTRDGVLVETRFIHRYGPETSDFVFATYQWVTGGANHVPAGVMDANGTPHNIPPEGQCANCHSKLSERVLGFSAIQLSHNLAGSVSFASLVEAGRIVNPSSPTGYEVPGNAVESAALGYLHSNCGNCHNDTGAPVPLLMRLLTSQTTVQTTDTFISAVGQNAQNFCGGACQLIDPGDPASSAVLQRLNARGDNAQMPPLITQATEIIDPTGIAAVQAWIEGLQ
jgi:hypothetical protein